MAYRPSFGTAMLWLFVVIFFVSLLVLFAGIPDMYNSPDERASAESINSFIETGSFILSEPENQKFGGVLSPRSMVSVGDSLAPVAFPGLLLTYGFIGKILSFPLAKFITPLLAVLAILAWKKILESFLSRRAALIGSFLLLLSSGFWFYSARVFMNNVPFLSLCIFGIYFLSCTPFRVANSVTISRFLNVAFAGFMFGLALLFRASEALWLAVAGMVFAVFFFRQIAWKKLALFLIAVAIGFAPFFLWNSIVFGHPLKIGYATAPLVSFESGAESLLSDIVDAVPSLNISLFDALFPFGFHPRLAWKNFADYQLGITWWMTALSVLGLPFLLFSKKRKENQTRVLRAVLVSTMLAGTYLTFFYGSWKIVDNPDPWSVTLANSYVRYWLPIYLAGTIPSALFIEWFAGKARTLFAQRIVVGVILLAVGVLSVRTVFFHPDDGLMKTRQVLGESIAIRNEIVRMTEEDSVIIVDRADKILFPVRRVVTPLRSEETYASIPLLISNHPLYYFGITLPESDFEYLREVVLEPRGILISPIKTIFDETLYKLSQL
jgi:hypothetical protein